MNPTIHQTQPSRFPATRLAVLATAAPRRRSARLASFATLALGLGGLASTAQATLQVYEPFNYTTGQTLNGQTGGTGFASASAWSAGNSGTSPYATPNGIAVCDATTQTLWNGTVTSVPQTGKFIGSPAPAGNASSGLNGNNPGDEWATRALDPAVVATFTLGSVTWLSYIEASNFKANGNGTGGSIAIAQGNIGSAAGSNRGWQSYGGSAIGIGVDSAKKFRAAYWDGSGAANLTGTQGAAWLTTGAPQISIAKITWGNASTPTTIQEATFNDGTALTEAAFNAAAVSTIVTIDPSTFINLALGGARYNVDELRLGTAFNDAIGVVVTSYGNYWAPGASGGGSGNWDSTTLDWAGVPNVQGALGQSPTANLVFSGTAGAVTINGSVTAVAGIEFLTTGYSLVAGASSPTLILAGADAAANTITVSSGLTSTIAALVTGSHGLTKDGSGTLVLSDTSNTYSGGTQINAGVLQVADLGSLGSNVTFGGGTLQYPAGSGASALDLSGKINAVASGQVAKIDTDGSDVTFGTALTGSGGLTKLGSGSLTLAANNSSLTGAVTVSAGTLNVSSASGTIATLNVPTGGTVNLAAGSVVTTLNITGGTVHITGAGVVVGTLVASAGTLEAASHSLSVTTQATVAGVTLSGTAVTLSGANVIAPDSGNHRVIAASSGTLGFVATGLDAAIGIASPGANALPSTASFSGNGAWALNGGVVADLGNTYGADNHAFHYIQIPAGDFDIRAHVTATSNARAGLMVRNTLASSPAPSTLPPNPLPYSATGIGNWAGIWTGLVASVMDGATPVPQNLGAMNSTPYLKITRVGSVITTYYSADGATYTQAQQRDYALSTSGWGATTYVGLDLISTLVTSVSATFDNVNFMGTLSLPDMSTTDLALSGGALVDVKSHLHLGTFSVNTVAQPDGMYNSTTTPASIASGEIQIGLDVGNDIVSFGPGAVISGTNILWPVPHGTDLTTLAPTFTVSTGATGSPASGVAANFTTPQTYTVTAENGGTKVYTVAVSVSPATLSLNVNIDRIAKTESGLSGPAGGLGTRWNQALVPTGNGSPSATAMLDSNGAATSVGFTCSTASVDPWGSPPLTMLTSAAYNFATNTPANLVLTGLNPAKLYDLYIACYYPNENGSKGQFTTSNVTTSAATQSCDNGGGAGNNSTWVQGTNYVRFLNVAPDGTDKITVSFVSGDASFRTMVNGFQVVEVVPTGMDYSVWAASYLPTNVSNLTADTDGDGLSNFQEYAFGLNPTSAASVSPITVPLNKSNGTFSYTRRDPTLSGLTYTVLTSTDLQTWTPDAGATQTRTTLIDGVETVEVQVSAGLRGSQRLFVRLEGIQP